MSLERFARIPPRTRRGDVTDAIRTMVLQGDMRVGERVKDTDLAQGLGVSRATVREAVGQLVHEGILTREPYRGLRVADPADSSLLDIARVRVALESLAAEQVAAAHDEQQFSLLTAQAVRLERARSLGDDVALAEDHFRFHRLVHQLSGIEVLLPMWEVLEGRIRLALVIDLQTRPDRDRVVRDHRLMVDALWAGKMPPAQIVERHIAPSAMDVISERRRGRSTGGEHDRARP